MSYILDALRRLEQDKERAKRGANPMEAVLIPDAGSAEEPQRRRLWLASLGVVLLVTVIAVTYWIARHTLVPSTHGPREGTVPHLASPQAGYDRTAPASLPEAGYSSLQPHPSARKRGETSANRVASSSPDEPSLSPPTRTPPEVTYPSVPIRAEEGSRPAMSIGADVSPRRQEERIAPSREASEDEAFQEWTGPEIRINAIAYSRNAENRFAVVNLKTVHAGDRFEGLTVVEIQENGIVFEEGGTKYRVLLGKR